MRWRWWRRDDEPELPDTEHGKDMAEELRKRVNYGDKPTRPQDYR